MVYIEYFRHFIRDRAVRQQVKEIKIHPLYIVQLLDPVQGCAADAAAGAVFKDYFRLIVG